MVVYLVSSVPLAPSSISLCQLLTGVQRFRVYTGWAMSLNFEWNSTPPQFFETSASTLNDSSLFLVSSPVKLKCQERSRRNSGESCRSLVNNPSMVCSGAFPTTCIAAELNKRYRARASVVIFFATDRAHSLSERATLDRIVPHRKIHDGF